MTNPDYTAIAVLVDRSGSMSSIKNDAEGALREFVKVQSEVDGRCTIRLSQFDTEYNDVYRSVDIKEAPEFSLEPRGGTALNDGIGRLVSDFGRELKQMPEESRPGRVLFVIITDGEENSSKEYTRAEVKKLVEKQTDKYNWNFVFLAANQDAVVTGDAYGFYRGSTMTFVPNATGLLNTTTSLNNYAISYRGTGSAAFTDEDRLAAVDSST